jgi:glycosyltransferase involved in cell wall biosynthesis
MDEWRLGKMLTFNLKKEWFEKIKRGEKTHEYREVKPYWIKRIGKELLEQPFHFLYINGYIYPPSYITFVCGYAPKEDKSKRLKARVKDINIINGKETDLKIDRPVYDIEFELI